MILSQIKDESKAAEVPIQASILLVDDTQANLQLLTNMVRQRGYKARPVLSGKLALQAAQNNPPDLILLDIHMPEMDGYQVCAQLKADPRLKDVPVIFLSALGETADKVKAFSAGGVDYITKPFQFEEVEARIHTHLQLHRQRQQLSKNYAELQRLETLRDKLTHMVVHDMRSPLLALDGFLGLLKETEVDHLGHQGREYLTHCNRATASLIEMVNSLLDVSKMEAGQMKLHLTDWDLPALISDVVARFDPLKENRQISVSKPEFVPWVEADKALISRVIENLLSNALKFTKIDGQIRFFITFTETQVRIAVSDDGFGIPKQFHQRIFEKFGQVEHCKERVGTGLGLTFCKLVMQAHQGGIGVDSEVGKGSEFWFTLPLKAE